MVPLKTPGPVSIHLIPPRRFTKTIWDPQYRVLVTPKAHHHGRGITMLTKDPNITMVSSSTTQPHGIPSIGKLWRILLLVLWVIMDGNRPTLAQEGPPRPGLRLGSQPVDKILFLGNSITLHPPAPNIGWSGNWGMAASAPDKDYVHRLLAKIASKAGRTPQFRIRNIAELERKLTDFDLATQLKEELDYPADWVIVAIGENVPSVQTETERTRFASALDKLFGELKRRGRTRILVRGVFWPDPIKNDILKAASDRAGALFVDLGTLGNDPNHAAKSEQKIDHPGVAAHPGDKGMEAIATALWVALEKACKP